MYPVQGILILINDFYFLGIAHPRIGDERGDGKSGKGGLESPLLLPLN